MAQWVGHHPLCWQSKVSPVRVLLWWQSKMSPVRFLVRAHVHMPGLWVQFKRQLINFSLSHQCCSPSLSLSLKNKFKIIFLDNCIKSGQLNFPTFYRGTQDFEWILSEFSFFILKYFTLSKFPFFLSLSHEKWNHINIPFSILILWCSIILFPPW